MASKQSQPFSVTRQAPELIAPAEPTPHELKRLSDIDDQEGLRFHVPIIFFFRNNPSSAMKGKDPAKVIRDSLSKALVFYYPFAGRVREGDNRKLLVECNGEGVLFVEADANVTLDQFGPEIQPPFACLDELLYVVPGSDGIIGCPLLSIQVTRLECGGFILALRWNHTLTDAYGFTQFLKTMEQMIQGAPTPSTIPVWQRDLLSARNPPRVTRIHHEYEQFDDSMDILKNTNPNDLVNKAFFFGPEEITSLRKQLPPHFKNCSTFELITACVWRCRTAALQLDPNQIVRLSCLISVRNKRYNFHLPEGYYGNSFALPATRSKAELLCKRGLGYAVELVKSAKAQMSGEYIQSVADLMEMKGRIKFTSVGNFILSYVKNSGLADVEFGWGKAVYGGPTGAVSSMMSFCMEFKNMEGKSGILLLICLPKSTMERFQEEMKKMTQVTMEDFYDINSALKISRL